MNALTALLLMKDLPIKAVGVYISLLQCAEPSGAIRESRKSCRNQYKRLTGKRITASKFDDIIDLLVERELMPSKESLYSLSFLSSPSNERSLDDIVERIEKDMSEVKPDGDNFPEQRRICGALIAVKALEVAVKRKRKTLEDPETGEAVLNEDGTVQKYWKRVWDYGFMRKLQSDYGVESMITTIFEMHHYDRWSELRQNSFQKTRKHMRKYFIGAVSGDKDIKSDDERAELIY